MTNKWFPGASYDKWKTENPDDVYLGPENIDDLEEEIYQDAKWPDPRSKSTADKIDYLIHCMEVDLDELRSAVRKLTNERTTDD